MTIRKNLAKKIYWRESRIRRIATNLLAKYGKITGVSTHTENVEFAGETLFGVMPYYMAEYLLEYTDLDIENVYSSEWREYETAVAFYWGEPSERGIRTDMVIRYPHKFDSEAPAGEFCPEAKRIVDAIKYLDADWYYLGAKPWTRSHIEGADWGRLSIPPRLVFNDIRRAFDVIVDIAREKGYY